jgi:hypothetical protein
MGYANVWLVERYLETANDDRLQRLAMQTANAVRTLRSREIQIAHLGSTLIPDEQTCFCVFLASTPEAIASLNALVDAPCVRTVAGLQMEALG